MQVAPHGGVRTTNCWPYLQAMQVAKLELIQVMGPLCLWQCLVIKCAKIGIYKLDQGPSQVESMKPIDQIHDISCMMMMMMMMIVMIKDDLCNPFNRDDDDD